MATNSLPQTFQPISASAVHVLARLAARRAVTAELRAQGVRVTLVKPAEISARAQVYLQEHPELIAQAKPKVERMILGGVFGKRAQRSYVRGSMNRILSQPNAIWYGQLEQDIAELVFELFHKSEHSTKASNVISGKTTNDQRNANNGKPNTAAPSGKRSLQATGILN